MRSVLGNHELSTTDHWSAFTVAAQQGRWVKLAEVQRVSSHESTGIRAVSTGIC